MSSVAFDTLKFVEKLEAGGFTTALAKAAASAFADATGEQLVTSANLKDELAPIKTDIVVLKWMIGLVIAGILALVLRAYFPH